MELAKKIREADKRKGAFTHVEYVGCPNISCLQRTAEGFCPKWQDYYTVNHYVLSERYKSLNALIIFGTCNDDNGYETFRQKPRPKYKINF